MSGGRLDRSLRTIISSICGPRTAVDLALAISVGLAKQIAAMPSSVYDNELKKKLWKLKIGKENNFLINNIRFKMSIFIR